MATLSSSSAEAPSSLVDFSVLKKRPLLKLLCNRISGSRFDWLCQVNTLCQQFHQGFHPIVHTVRLTVTSILWLVFVISILYWCGDVELNPSPPQKQSGPQSAKCPFCACTFTKHGIGRHLNACKKREGCDYSQYLVKKRLLILWLASLINQMSMPIRLLPDHAMWMISSQQSALSMLVLSPNVPLVDI